MQFLLSDYIPVFTFLGLLLILLFILFVWALISIIDIHHDFERFVDLSYKKYYESKESNDRES